MVGLLVELTETVERKEMISDDDDYTRAVDYKLSKIFLNPPLYCWLLLLEL